MVFEWWKFLVKEIEIDKENCLRKYNSLNCKDCVKVCSREAITLNSDDISINKEKCTFCGLCRAECPTGVIKYDYNPYGFIKGKDFFYLCEASVQKGYSSCLGWLDISQILSVFSKEQIKRVVLSPGDCQQCFPEVMGKLEKKVDICRVLLSHFYEDKEIIIEKLSKNSFNRQEILNFFKDKVFYSVKNQFFTPFLERFNYKNERDLLIALKSLGEIKDEWVESYLLPWGELEIDSKKCDFCGTCFKLCPSGSLFSKEEYDSLSIFQKPSECSKCKLCIEVCDKNAIYFLPKNNLKQFIEEKEKLLVKRENKKCLCCNSSFVDSFESKICINCRNNEILKRDIKELMNFVA